MQDFIDIIKMNALFEGIPSHELQKVFIYMNAYQKCYEVDETILHVGDTIHSIGILIDGEVQVYREDMDGKQHMIVELHKGDMFAEVFVCASITKSPVHVLANKKTQILHLDYEKLIHTCDNKSSYHTKIIENMLKLIANKNLTLNEKIEILSKRTTRERLLLYFHKLGKGNNQFTIPFNREELATYLCVERSAMSAELSRMQKDGLINIHKNHVTILKNFHS